MVEVGGGEGRKKMCLPAVTVPYRAFNLRKIMEFAKFSKSCSVKQKNPKFS